MKVSKAKADAMGTRGIETKFSEWTLRVVKILSSTWTPRNTQQTQHTREMWSNLSSTWTGSRYVLKEIFTSVGSRDRGDARRRRRRSGLKCHAQVWHLFRRRVTRDSEDAKTPLCTTWKSGLLFSGISGGNVCK